MLLSASEARRERRMMAMRKKMGDQCRAGPYGAASLAKNDLEDADSKFLKRLLENEDQLLEFVAQVNSVYQEKLHKPAPFMTFILIGMQSAGKSTIVERFLQRVINVVKEGTGTRCPLDITCIHDDSAAEPVCELSNCDAPGTKNGKNLPVEDVFKSVTMQNETLAKKNEFSKKPIYLVIRSKEVQNMRFVDLPGIISNKSKGIDNRDDIKEILRAEISKPNSRMCVLLEPKEFATNPIIDFIDETMEGRDNWVDKADFFMTKFDMRLGDSRTGSKANAFFQEFKDNGVVPYMVITPTLDSEKLDPAEMFKQRQELLNTATRKEEARFKEWLAKHKAYLQSHPDDELLDAVYHEKIGFRKGVAALRETMLADTAKRLPEVLVEIRKQLKLCEKEHKLMKERQKYNDPKELRIIVTDVVHKLQQRIFTYLDGSMEIAMKFPERLQTLEEEIVDEEESDWANRELNHFTEEENAWREHITTAAEENGEYPRQVQPNKPFLGGKQYQRAMHFFRCNMIDHLPAPHNLKDFVAHSTGYLAGGLQRENWERAMVEITKRCVKQVTHPGINFFVKHVGSIFRRLFSLALDDIRKGEEFSVTFQLLPTTVERFLSKEFDDMLWKLMKSATDKIHCSLEPMYSTINPNLPTFVQTQAQRMDLQKHPELYVFRDGAPQLWKPERKREPGFFDNLKLKMSALISGSGEEAKRFLREENEQRAGIRKEFLSDKRASMITDTETDIILQRSFEYIAALMEWNLFNMEFHFDHHLYQGFKDALQDQFCGKLVVRSDFESLVDRDPVVEDRVAELEKQIEGLQSSLRMVTQMQTKLR
ncbi:unnamed protein product [Amoebophrya sp. A25]|nr:unnamed protein product [Amoebophrya sp. A25]|eukprot:GSA25T00018695001.1